MQALAPSAETASPAALIAIDYRDGDVPLRGELALPAGDAPHAGVLVLHSGLGMTDVLRAETLKLAAHGYVAFAADLYASRGETLEPSQAGERMIALQRSPERLRARIAAGFDVLAGHDAVDGDRIGAIGFCFGGQCALELARSGADVKATLCFHGLLTTQTPAEPGAIRGQVAVYTGAKDPLAPAADVAALRAELTQAGAAWQITEYGEGYHGFSSPEGRPYEWIRHDPLLEAVSWGAALALLDATIGAGRAH